MGTKIKGLYKGFKYISQIFAAKEREMEIGHPTDVKHVAHVGWDGQSANAPRWMNEYKTSSDFSASSLSNLGVPSDPSCFTVTTWSSLDFEPSLAQQPACEIFQDSAAAPIDLPKVPKKHKRKKTTSKASIVESIKSSKTPNTLSWLNGDKTKHTRSNTLE